MLRLVEPPHLLPWDADRLPLEVDAWLGPVAAVRAELIRLASGGLMTGEEEQG